MRGSQVFPHGADPWVIEDEGRFYYCYSTGNGVAVAQIASPDLLTTAGGRTVYTAPAGTPYSQEYWAPELHKLDGEWYVYVAADDGHNENHRMYVLRAQTDDPTGPFSMVGKLTDPTDRWAIDGTVFSFRGEWYTVWSGWEGTVNEAQHLYIAHMASPTQIEGERVRISSPEHDWETRGGMPKINEGPCALVDGDSLHLLYSASGSWCDDYCLGKLTLRGEDPMDPASWVKSPVPFLEKCEGMVGPGHCSAAGGKLIYHANERPGTGWGGRSVWTLPLHFEQGEPILG